MSLGVNMQWGYAGLFNAGIMGFAALGGMAAIVVSMPPIEETWAVGGAGVLMTFVIFTGVVISEAALPAVGAPIEIDPTCVASR